MTAFAYEIRPGRLVVASDTMAYVPNGGPLCFIDKVIPLPRFHAVLFMRGMHAIGVAAAGALATAPALLDIEDAAAALPEILRRLTAEYCGGVGIDDPASALLVNLMFAGWSESDRRMKLWWKTCAGAWKEAI